jgi:hypothetical protein
LPDLAINVKFSLILPNVFSPGGLSFVGCMLDETIYIASELKPMSIYIIYLFYT